MKEIVPPEPPAVDQNAVPSPGDAFAPRPHQHTVLLSVAALTISILSALASGASWYENHNNRQINEAATKAYVNIDMISRTAPGDDENTGGVLDAEHAPAFGALKFTVTLKNLGKVAATEVDLVLRSCFFNAMELQQGLSHVTDCEETNVGFSSLAPGEGVEYPFWVPLNERTRALLSNNLGRFHFVTEMGYWDLATQRKVSRQDEYCVDATLLKREDAIVSLCAKDDR